MSDTSVKGDSAALQITRRRQLVGAFAKWIVNVDGDRVAQIRNGEVVRVAIPQGPHKVTISTKSGLACSNELDLDLKPGDSSALTCGINRSYVSTFLGGLSALPPQVRTLRSSANGGGVIKGMIELINDANT